MSKSIPPLSHSIDEALQQKIDQKTKPLGALGVLESLALQIGRIQKSLTPQLHQPHLLLFAADHGAVVEGISAYPKEVTWQMVENILRGGAAASVFARQAKITLSVVDAGVDHKFLPHPSWIHNFIDKKIAAGSANYVVEPAMSGLERDDAMARGGELVENIQSRGCNVIAFGEMGIGNTSAAALLMHVLGKVALDDCIGRGAGLDDAGLARKHSILARALQRVDANAGMTPGKPLTTPLTKGITVGIKHLLEAKEAMIMANGESKAEIVKRLVSEEINEKLPATVLRKHSNGLLWIDKAAAADL